MKTFKFLCTLLMIFVCGTVYATDAKVSISLTDKDGNSELTVAPGKSVDVYLNVKNTGDKALVVSSTLSIKLPEGFEYDGKPELVQENWNCSNSIVTFDLKSDGVWYISVNKAEHSDADITFNKAEGQMYKFTLKATTAVASETPYKATIDMFYTSDASAAEHFVIDDYEGETLDFYITVKEAAAVDITLANASGYNSYCCDKDLDVTGFTDAKFYIVSSVTATEATLTQVTNGIPAGEGFLIEGSGTANISVPVAATAPTATGSKLVGVTAATDIEAGNYILKSDGSSFVPCTAGKLPANKAYLPKGVISASAKEFLMIVEDAVVTGINEVQAENSVNGPIYNLNGARVSNPQKGVYIMNGRKVIVK